LPSQPPSP